MEPVEPGGGALGRGWRGKHLPWLPQGSFSAGEGVGGSLGPELEGKFKLVGSARGLPWGPHSKLAAALLFSFIGFVLDSTE